MCGTSISDRVGSLKISYWCKLSSQALGAREAAQVIHNCKLLTLQDHIVRICNYFVLVPGGLLMEHSNTYEEMKTVNKKGDYINILEVI